MFRLQLALNVDDLDEAVAFYATLFGTAPAKRHPATPTSPWPTRRSSWCCSPPPRQTGTAQPPRHRARDDRGGRRSRPSASRPPASPSTWRATWWCCYARQDKHWVTGPTASGGRTTWSSRTPSPTRGCDHDGADGQRRLLRVTSAGPGPPGGRRVPRHRSARHRRGRLRHRRPAAVPRRRRAAAAGELHRDRARADRAHPDVRTGLRAPTSTRSCRSPTGRSGRRTGTVSPRRTSACTPSRRSSARSPAAMLANLMFDVPAAALSTTDRSGAGLLLGEVVATAGLVILIFALARTGRAVRRRAGGGRLHRRGVLVHLVHVVRQPRRHRRPGLHRHLRRHRPRLGARLRARPARRGAVASPSRPLPGVARSTTSYPRQEPRMTRDPTNGPRVVFACVRNGGRSVIGRLLTEHYAGGRVVARSAGTEPGEHIHPEVAEALRTSASTPRGAPDAADRRDGRGQRPRHHPGCGEECPYVPGVRYVDWPSTTRGPGRRHGPARSSPTSTPGSARCSSSSCPTSSCHPRSSTSPTPRGPRRRAPG